MYSTVQRWIRKLDITTIDERERRGGEGEGKGVGQLCNAMQYVKTLL
jgi:hypothetical protein